MRSSVTPDGVDQLLEGLNSQNELAANETVLKGPFGLFHANVCQWKSRDLVPVATDAHCTEMQGEAVNWTAITNCLVPEPCTSLDMDDIVGSLDVDAGFPNHASAFPIGPGLEGAWPARPSPLDLHLNQHSSHEISQPLSSCAPFLLEHYKFQSDKLFSPLRSRKPPWEVLHLPCALSTFAELTLFKATTHTKKSLFYAILAVSAFNLDKMTLGQKDGSNYWWVTGEHFTRLAKEELGLSYANELDGVNRAKYKDLLMAILTIVTVSVRLVAYV